MTDYNGWKNYPTWAVALWLGNEQATEADTRRIADDWNERTREEGGAVSELADALRAYVESLPDVEAVTDSASLASDLLGFALDSADWYEIAECFAADLLGDDSTAELERRRSLVLTG